MIIVYAKKEEESSIEELTELLAELKSALKSNDIAAEICQENGFPIDIIDGVVMEFADHDKVGASAKTIDGKIMLNKKLIDGPFEQIMRYAVHELVHVFQHMEREGVKGDPYEGEEYLDRPDELEAFQFQIKFENDECGEEDVKDYIDELLEYHDIPKDDKNEKKEELLEKADDR